MNLVKKIRRHLKGQENRDATLYGVLGIFALLMLAERDIIMQFPRVEPGEVFLQKYGQLFILIIIFIPFFIYGWNQRKDEKYVQKNLDEWVLDS